MQQMPPNLYKKKTGKQNDERRHKAGAVWGNVGSGRRDLLHTFRLPTVRGARVNHLPSFATLDFFRDLTTPPILDIFEAIFDALIPSCDQTNETQNQLTSEKGNPFHEPLLSRESIQIL